VRKREFEFGGEELLDVWTLDIGGLFNFDDFEDMNRTEARAMSSSHVLVQGNNGISSRHLSVLFVHVVGAGAGIISDPDTEVLDFERALLMDFVQGDDLTISLLDLAEFHQEVPETGLGDHGVGCEYAHAVELGGWVCLRWQVAADDLVFGKTTCSVV